MLTTPDIAPSLRPGMHAATFGGNPIAASAGIATLETIEQEELLPRGRRLGEQFRQRLETLRETCPVILDVRSVGLMIGIELTIEGGPIVQSCMERNLLINCTQGTVIRLLPAMTMTPEQVDEGCDILAAALERATHSSQTDDAASDD